MASEIKKVFLIIVMVSVGLSKQIQHSQQHLHQQ